MRSIFAIFLATFIFLTLPLAALAQVVLNGQSYGEMVAITATAATATQTSALITKPPQAIGVLAYIDVTAGSSLLLDINMLVHSPTANADLNYSLNCPSNGAITGTGDNYCVFYPAASMTTPYGEAVVPIPQWFKLQIDHGNTNAATYVLYYSWIFGAGN